MGRRTSVHIPYKANASACRMRGHHHDHRDCPGAGKIKCELCGFPLTHHELDTHPQIRRGVS